MRTSHVCPRCHHGRVLLIASVPDLVETTRIRPLTIATVVAGRTFMGDDQLGTAGALSAAVCRACGYVELYVADPATIPIDGTYVREVSATP